jgi:hypothetical protein
MSLTNYFLIDNAVYGTPSGNYDGSSLAFTSGPGKGVGYYQGQGGLQTVLIRVTNFPGTITLQASLDFDPETANWFDVHTFGDGSSTISDYVPVNLTGNFVWIRAVIGDFSSGTINGVSVSY